MKYLLLLSFFPHIVFGKTSLAIIDTGLDMSNHEIKKYFELPERNTSSLPRKYIIQKDFTSGLSQAVDHDGHGTHVTGIIIEQLKQFNILSSKVDLYILKYFDKTKKNYDPLVTSKKALKYAIESNVQIINYSGGGETFDQEEFELLVEAKKRGIILVAAAGNNGESLYQKTFFPASYRLSNILIVSSLDQKMNVPNWSNFGKSDVAAPGKDIESYGLYNNRLKLSGTSQSTALVTSYLVYFLKENPEIQNWPPYRIIDHFLACLKLNLQLKNKIETGLFLPEKEDFMRNIRDWKKESRQQSPSSLDELFDN